MLAYTLEIWLTVVVVPPHLVDVLIRVVDGLVCPMVACRDGIQSAVAYTVLVLFRFVQFAFDLYFIFYSIGGSGSTCGCSYGFSDRTWGACS